MSVIYTNDIQVNTFTSGSQNNSSVTTLDDGRVVIVWQSELQDYRDTYGIFAQVFSSDGITQGNEFQVNTYTIGNQTNPTITPISGGGFSVAWQSYNQTGSYDEFIYCQLYDANINTIGQEFLVAPELVENQSQDRLYPSITTLGNGNFLITYVGQNSDGSGYGVLAQIYNSDGTVQVTEFPVNTYTLDDQGSSGLSSTTLSNGGFVIAWDSEWQNSLYNGIFAQIYNDDGIAQGEEFQLYISGDGTNTAYLHDIMALGNGNFVAVYVNTHENTSGIYGQIYSQNGGLLGTEFLINTFESVYDSTPYVHDITIAGLANGNFIAVWQSTAQFSYIQGLYAQIFNNDGQKVGDEFRVSGITDAHPGGQQSPSVSSLNNGGFVITWQSYVQDGDGWDVFTQFFDESGNSISALSSIPYGISGNIVSSNIVVQTALQDLGWTNVNNINSSWNELTNTLNLSFNSGTNENIEYPTAVTPRPIDIDLVTEFILNAFGYSNINSLSTSWNTSSNVLDISFSSANLLYSGTNLYLTNATMRLDLDNSGNVSSFSSSAYNSTYGWLSNTYLTSTERSVIREAFEAIDAVESLTSSTTTNDIARFALELLGYSYVNGLSTSWDSSTNTSTIYCDSAYGQVGYNVSYVDNVVISITTNTAGNIVSFSHTGVERWNGQGYQYNINDLDVSEIFVIEAAHYVLGELDGLTGDPNFNNVSATIVFDSAGNLTDFTSSMNTTQAGQVSFDESNLTSDEVVVFEQGYINMIGTNNDLITLNSGSGTIDGGDGIDTLYISYSHYNDNTIGISTDGSTIIINSPINLSLSDISHENLITNVEILQFSTGVFTIAELQANNDVRELFYEMVLNDAGTAYDQVYVMPELFLFPGNPEMEALYDYSYVMPTDNTVGDIIVGSSGNDFINGMGGGDGIIAGDGNDVIDGGLGSNFLTGGNGDDVFYADGRGAHVAGWTREDDEVWTTVTDFNNGNSQATIWGYIDGTSTYTWEANQGAAGWEGITLRADLDGNGVVDTSFTFTGIDNQSELTLATNVVGDLGYILVS